ncbi:MAG TPA: prolyl oligopeptidase family serine peptidase [Thermoanaerobaculia bacterium]|nr:prolyl oligopeptidase family serine peptidase [Thermoanaerobaculia bacterium]
MAFPSNCARRTIPSALTVAVAGLVFAAGSIGVAQQPSRLTLERLYSLPSLIGTAPGGFAWSPDSRRLAFLWNDEGMPFRDVWVLDLDEAPLAPRRATRFVESAGAAEPMPADPLEAAAHQERIERDRGVAAVTWHPDGVRLLATYRGDLWLVGLDGESAPENVTESAAAESRAAFSHTGDALAMLRLGDLWIAALDDRGRPAAPRRVTSLGSEAVRIGGFAFSPDGSQLWIRVADSSRVPRRSIPDYLHEEPEMLQVRRAHPGEEPVRERVAVVSAAGDAREIRWLETAQEETDPVWSVRWSPDGRFVAVDTSDLFVKRRRILIADPQTGDARTLVEESDPHNVTAGWQIEWARNGSGLYFLSDREDDVHVWRADLETGTTQRITPGPGAVAGFEVTPEALIVVSNRDRAEGRQIDRVALSGGKPRSGGEPHRLSRRPGTHEPTVSPDGRWAAVAFSSDTTPPELLLTDLGSGPIADTLRERRITVSPIDEFSRYDWVEPSYVTFPSQVDDTILHGRLTLPPDLDRGEKHPAILGSVYSDTVRNQWGGRTAHPTWALDQFLVQEGYVLLNVDIRGSWGHGREHRQGIYLDYGGIDVEDLASGVAYLESLGFVDMERVGLWGSSYGGLLTTMSLFRKPELYAAGVAGAPATNVRHALTGQMTVMMHPEDHAAEYDDSSSFTHAAGLEDPLLIIHGMRDTIVLYRDTVNLVQRLIALGKGEHVDVVTLPDAGHGWDTEGLAQTRFAFGKLVEFFDRHLMGER